MSSRDEDDRVTHPGDASIPSRTGVMAVYRAEKSVRFGGP